jgi:phenylpyruvate tautomerase PptA (4-oxalocrotonate tautomerase family)
MTDHLQLYWIQTDYSDKIYIMIREVKDEQMFGGGENVWKNRGRRY